MTAHPLLTGPELGVRALCAEVGGDGWYPETGDNSRKARDVCAGCEVRVACLEWALANNERFGIWGGLSTKQREEVARGRARTPQPRAQQPIVHGTEAGARAHQRRHEKPCGPCADGGRTARRRRAAA